MVAGDGSAKPALPVALGRRSSDAGSSVDWHRLHRTRRHAARTARRRPPPQPPQMSNEDSMEILRALERGEIDVEEASRRLGGAGSQWLTSRRSCAWSQRAC